jgi:arylsulfatase
MLKIRQHINNGFALMTTAFVIAFIMAGSAGAQGKIDRTVLPIQEPEQPTYSELDVRNVKAPPRFEVKAPAKAPNVVIVLIDDVGFGATSTFGGPIQTPTLDNLAAAGLRYNNFHTTALCSPTRNALKTGRNHHTTNTGSIMETATAFPGNTGQIPNSVAPLAEMLRLNGYSTGAFGKWHETAAWETSVSGPFDRWPTHQGFDKFYGFIGGETDQWYPLIYDGVTKVNPPKMENYHFTIDMTNQAINWMKAQQSMTPDTPFFVSYATGAVHAPHHVPKEWADKYKGQFDKGWDKTRQETFERQKKLGVIPANTKLAEKPKDIKDWDTLPADHRRLFARQAEVFAGFMEQTDHEVGRFVKALEDIGELDNTLFIYIAGDNGTSAEGGFVGMYNEMTYFNQVTEKVEDLVPLIDKWGGPETFPHMAAGWAVAFDAPFSTAWSFTGRRVLRIRVAFVPSSHTLSMWRPLFWRRQVCQSPRLSTERRRRPSRASACSTPSRMQEPGNGTPHSISRCSATGQSIAMAGLPVPSTGPRGRPANRSRWNQIPGTSTTSVRISASPGILPVNSPKSWRSFRPYS